MTVDPDVLPGLALLVLELLVLATAGFVVARVALRQRHDLLALAQGLAVGLALWGLIANLAMYLLPGMAGAVTAWVATIGIGAGLAWRTPLPLRLSARTAAVFVATALAVFWLALAGRQLLSLADDEIRHGLAASIRAGGFPPVVPWNPWQPATYHYGVVMLVGLLSPPTGPDLAFVNEILGAYIWTSLALVVIASIHKHGGWVATLVLSPLLLTAGAWTLFGSPNPPSIVQSPVPIGSPGVGIRTALTEVYWPSFDLPVDTKSDVSPPNSWRPSFPLSYVLVFIVLERIAVGRVRSWTTSCALAAILGFAGLVDESVALVGLALWIAFEIFQTVRFFQLRQRLVTQQQDSDANPYQNGLWTVILRAVVGPALTVVLLTVSGGVVTGLLTGSSHAGFALAWHENPASRRPLGELAELSGGLGILGLGPLVVATAAVLLAWRNPFILLLAIGSGAFLLAALALRYEPSPADISRLDGHARNFALLALLIALGLRLDALRTRYRYVAAAGLIALVTWPTAAAPARSLSLGLERGLQLSNMPLGPREFYEWFQGRHAVKRFRSEKVATYIRKHTPAEARVLSPHPHEMTIATGRPNASGFVNLQHFLKGSGPEYKDAIRFLEPAAIRKLGIDYVHATDTWLAQLPDRAVRRLNDPLLFESVFRDGADALYRITPAFYELDSPPADHSYEALGLAVPATSSVYLSPDMDARDALRASVALSHAQQFGDVDTSVLHLLSKLSTEPLGDREPDFVVTSSHVAPAAFAPDARRPIWWNNSLAVYAPSGGIEPITGPPPRHFSVELSDLRRVDERIAFTTTFTDRASDRWTGQDWVVISVEDSPWGFPDRSRTSRRTQAPARTFAGQIQPVAETNTHEYFYLYEFHANTADLTVWDGNSYVRLTELSRYFGPGAWMLAVRLLRGSEEVALVPLIRFELNANGEFSYRSYDGPLNNMLLP